MKNNTQQTAGHIVPPISKEQWKRYQQIELFTQNLNRMPDARAVRDNKPQSAPQHLLPMVF